MRGRDSGFQPSVLSKEYCQRGYFAISHNDSRRGCYQLRALQLRFLLHPLAGSKSGFHHSCFLCYGNHERYHISWQREKPSCQGSLLLLQQDFRVRCSFNTNHRMTIHQQKER
nr:MAG TPA: hypothetical protein [Caudoviricetes sp.]